MEKWSDWGRYTRKNGKNKYKTFVKYLKKEIRNLKEFKSQENVPKLITMMEKYYEQIV